MNPAEIAAQVIALVKKQAPDAEGVALVELGRQNQTRFAANEITTAGDVEIASVEVTIARGKRHASTSSTRATPEGLAVLVERAAAMAALAPEDPEWMGVLGLQTIRPAAANSFDAATFALPAAVRAVAAKKAIAIAEQKSAIAAGFYEAEGRTIALSTTAGLMATHSATHARFTMTARSTDGTGSGWSGVERTSAADIDSPAFATTAVDKAIRSQKPAPLEPKPYKVVLDPACVADMLGFFLESLDTRRADEGRSFFSKKGGGSRVGEKMFAAGLTLKGDPFDVSTPAMPFDGEGLAIEPTTFVESGTLRALVNGRFWAQKTGTKPCAYPSALHLLGGESKSIDQLISAVDRGLYVTRFWYTRWLDPQTMTITGLTRDGVFLIENGAIKGPVNNFRFNESPAAVLAKAKSWTKETFRLPARGLVLRVPRS